MLLSRASLAFLLAAAICAAPVFATPTHKKPATTHARSTTHHAKHSSSRSRHTARSSRRHKLHGQQAIAPERASEIQQALIREHYLTGQPTGQWDSATIAAMKKYQADQGWQTKLMPDSRALKKLGLGPDYSDAINADGSSFSPTKSTSDIPTAQAAGFAEASGVNH